MITPAEVDDVPNYDARTAEQIRYDAISDQLRDAAALARDLAETVRDLVNSNKASNVQTVIHKSQGMGAWAAAAVCACFFTFLALIVFAIWIVPEIHDLKAWRDIHQNHISAIEAREQKK